MARNLLGPALEFVFGVRTLVVWPPGYVREAPLIRQWIDDGMAIGALTAKTPLDGVTGTEEFETVERPVWWISALAQAEDRFPTEVSEDFTTINRYAAGRGSDPALRPLEARRRKPREHLVSRPSAPARRQPLPCCGGSSPLARLLESLARTMGYIVGDAESGVWQSALEAYGARFVRRELGGVVLFDEIEPQPAGTPLSSEDWILEASDGRGSERLAVDGRLDTRWASHAPQRPGMTFTIGFPRPTDVSWLRIRMGRFATDRARGLAVETSVDGATWNRQELPGVIEGIRWRDGVPEENADGDLDLWLNAAGLRALSPRESGSELSLRLVDRRDRNRGKGRAMKLVVQIPCLNEAENLPRVLADLPRAIEGIDQHRSARSSTTDQPTARRMSLANAARTTSCGCDTARASHACFSSA